MILFFSKIALVLAWILFLVLAYRVSLIETEHKDYDPFAVLNVDRVSNHWEKNLTRTWRPFQEATIPEIKRSYRDLSKKFHPDRGGDAEQFVSDEIETERDDDVPWFCRKKLPKLTRRWPMKKRKKTGRNMAILMDQEVNNRLIRESVLISHTLSLAFQWRISVLLFRNGWSIIRTRCSFCWSMPASSWLSCQSLSYVHWRNIFIGHSHWMGSLWIQCLWWQKSARYAGDQILIDTIQLYWIFLSKTSSIIVKSKLIERL